MENNNGNVVPASQLEVSNFMQAVKIQMGERASDLLNRDFNLIEKYVTQKDLYKLKKQVELKQFENVATFYENMYDLVQGAILKHAALQRDSYLSMKGTQYEREFIEYANNELNNLTTTMDVHMRNATEQMLKDYNELEKYKGSPAHDFRKTTLDAFYKTKQDNTIRLLEIFNERVKIKADSFRL
jgi:hypothetical protein